MKILFIEPMGYSGIFRHAVILGAELIQNGIEMQMVTSCQASEIESVGNRFTTYPILGGMNKQQSVIGRGIDYIKSWPILFKLIHEIKPEIVHFHQFTTPYLDWLLIGLLRLAGCHIIISVHELEPRNKSLSLKLTHQSMKWVFNLAHHLIVHSKYAYDQIIENYHIPSGKVDTILIGNYLDYKASSTVDKTNARKKLNLPDHSPLALFFGTIRSNKGLHVLLDAMKLVLAEIDHSVLVIAGVPERNTSFEEYSQQIQLLNLDSHVISRLDYVPNELVPVYFVAADIVVLPYVQVYQSAVVQLAFAFERPVIASNVGGLSEVIKDNETGLLVPPGDPKALADKMIQLFKNPEFSGLLGYNSLIKAKTDFGWDGIAQKTISVYTKVISD